MFQVYLVGGIVRDKLLGVESHDRDYVVVGATEQDMLAQGYKKVGADFPVFLNDEGDQFALARTERKTGFGYKGFSVVADSSVTLTEDLSRRDLTINAMAEDLSTQALVDPFNGAQDLKDKVLRHIGPAFQEDPLRVVRLARFYARWADFTVAAETLELCKQMVQSGELNALSDERLWVELDKLFKQSAHPERFFELLQQVDALEKVDFFKDLLGSSPVECLVKVAGSVASLDASDRLQVFVALGAGADAAMASNAVPVRVKALFKNVRAVLGLEPVASLVVDFFSFTRAFEAKCVHFPDVFCAMQVAEPLGASFPVSAKQLHESLQVASSVKASDFLSKGFRGAEIGRQLRLARIDKVTDVFGR